MAEVDLLLSVPVLTDMVRQRTPVAQPLAFTELFRRGGVIPADGDRVIFEKRLYSRKLAGVATFDNGEPYRSTGPNRKVVQQGLIHLEASRILGVKELFLGAGLNELMRSDAQSHIADAVSELTGSIHRTVEYICSELLLNSAGVSLGSANTAFPAGAVEINDTVTIDGSLQTLAMAAGWDVDSTEILSDDDSNQLTAALRTIEANGHEAYHAIHSRKVAQALMGNTEVKTFLTANGGMTIEAFKQAVNASARRQGEGGDYFTPSVWSGIGGIPSWLCWDHGYENRSGTFTRYMDDDKVILLPSELPRVLSIAEGLSVLPEGESVIGDAARADELFRVGRGLQACAMRVGGKRPGIEIVVKYAFAPMVRDENGILTLTGVTS